MPELVFTASVRPAVQGGIVCVDGTRIPADTVYAYSVNREGDDPSLGILLHYFPSLEGKVIERQPDT